MSDKSTTIRVKPYTKELIIKHSRAKRLTQNDLVEKAILVAEKMNFEYDLPLKEIEKMQVSQTNRLIGFLKTQDKNLKQTEENIYHFFQNRLKEDRREVLEYLSLNLSQQIREETEMFFKNDKESGEDFTKLFFHFFNKIYENLRKDINTIA